MIIEVRVDLEEIVEDLTKEERLQLLSSLIEKLSDQPLGDLLKLVGDTVMDNQ